MNSSRRQFNGSILGFFTCALLPEVAQADTIDNIQSVDVQQVFNLWQLFEDENISPTYTYEISITYTSGRNENYVSSPNSNPRYIKNRIKGIFTSMSNNTLLLVLSDNNLFVINDLVRVRSFDE